MSFPQLKSLTCDPDGQSLRLRVVLPPNLSAGRKSIPVKIEVLVGNNILPPEKLDTKQSYSLEAPDLLAALLLESWCQNRLASMIMLTPDQLRQLLQPLQGEPRVFSVRSPQTPLPWRDGQIPDVHEHLVQATPPSPSQPPKTSAAEPKPIQPAPSAQYSDYSPMEVDGSTQFLAISLPSRESTLYPEALALVKDNNFRLEPSNRKWWLRDRHKTLSFLAEHWDKLENHFGARFTENFRQRTANIRRAVIAFDTLPRHNGYTVELRIQAHNVPAEVISEALAKGQHHLESPRGDIVLIEPALLSKYTDVQHKLTGQRPVTPTPGIRHQLSHAELAFADEALEPLNLAARPPEEWLKRSSALRDLSRLEPAPLPDNLATLLRPYQQLGTSWLWHLVQHDLGGILADEMGLGKTIQALALIACLRRQLPDKGPCLVVCPAGLTGNWRREAAHFTPNLRNFVHHGNERLSSPEGANRYDLLITSYGTLVRDSKLFQDIAFSCAIADEAQHIKNRQTRNAKALRSLQATHRFLLTGTPVENSLDDLRSLFEFILPGYLPKAPTGLSRDEREEHQQRLRHRAAPYILRRTKQAVAPELPEKIEHTIYCELSPEQRSRYLEIEQQARRELLNLEMANASEGRLRMAAFQELLRLRQLCIDPRLLPGESDSSLPSAKLDTFLELLEESLDGGHRLLVFSQFTQALSLLRQELNTREVPYLYLDGQTRDRTALCERFNQDPSIPVFLISLKAGGTGLNLTGADTVVHYDPWWNPAVEAQATDRAHRIGQTRIVTSYKLIASSTVEERVLTLQRSKATLLRDIFEASEAANARIAFSDLKALLE